MDKIKLRNILLVFMTIVVFALSYYICTMEIREKSLYQVKDEYSSVNANSSLMNVVSKDGKLIFKLEYSKSGDLKIKKEESSKKLQGKTKSEIEDLYGKLGYKVEKFSPIEVVLVKKVDKYAPDKYVVGIKDGLIAIYKTNKNGDMFIENPERDITDIKTSRLKNKDIELLTKGDKYFQCNTLEEAQSRLEDYE